MEERSLNKPAPDPHSYLRERLDAIVETTAATLSQLDYDTLFDRMLDQKNAVIAELQQALAHSRKQAPAAPGVVRQQTKTAGTAAQQAAGGGLDEASASASRNAALVGAVTAELLRRPADRIERPGFHRADRCCDQRFWRTAHVEGRDRLVAAGNGQEGERRKAGDRRKSQTGHDRDLPVIRQPLHTGAMRPYCGRIVPAYGKSKLNEI